MYGLLSALLLSARSQCVSPSLHVDLDVLIHTCNVAICPLRHSRSAFSYRHSYAECSSSPDLDTWSNTNSRVWFLPIALCTGSCRRLPPSYAPLWPFPTIQHCWRAYPYGSQDRYGQLDPLHVGTTLLLLGVHLGTFRSSIPCTDCPRRRRRAPWWCVALTRPTWFCHMIYIYLSSTWDCDDCYVRSLL